MTTADAPDAKRPRGRPPLDDKRRPRGGFNDAEWREVKRNAAEWESCRSCGGTVPPEGRGCGCDSPDLRPMTAAAWLRMRAGV